MSQLPKICVVMSHLRPTLGIETATLSLVRELAPSSDVVLVLVGDLPEASDLASVPVSVLGAPLRGLSRVRSVFRLRSVNFEDFDAILLVGAWAALPFLASASQKLLRRTVVWEHSFDRYKLHSSRSLRLLALAARFLYKRASGIVVVSESLKSDLAELMGIHHARVIPNFVPATVPSDFRPDRFRQASAHLLSVGSLTNTKNQILAIDALAQLPEQFSLRILGDGPMRQRLADRANELGVASRVDFAGYTENVRDEMIAADVLVHPALGETFGIVLFEAASMSLPVVALSQSVMRDFIPKYVPGTLSANNSKAFATAVISTYGQPPSAAEFRAAEKERSEHFGPDRILEAWRTELGI